MSDMPEVRSKILFFENEDTHIERLKQFFPNNQLIGLRARSYSGVLEVIQKNVALGAVLLCESDDPDGISFGETALEIHKIRPELPIFLRRETVEGLEDLGYALDSAIAAAYRGADTETLNELFATHLFSVKYPDSMIRGIEKVTEEALQMVFHNVEIFTCVPYLIKDSLIFGQLFTMIPLESSWCRGYMLLQIEKSQLTHLIQQGRTPFSSGDTGAAELNGLLGEMTNMIWGRFKSHFFANDRLDKNAKSSQVPVIVDQDSSYISFGTNNPQLCFRYVIHDKSDAFDPVSIYQKFIFHLDWTPENYQEPSESVENLVELGEIELF